MNAQRLGRNLSDAVDVYLCSAMRFEGLTVFVDRKGDEQFIVIQDPDSDNLLIKHIPYGRISWGEVAASHKELRLLIDSRAVFLWEPEARETRTRTRFSLSLTGSRLGPHVIRAAMEYLFAHDIDWNSFIYSVVANAQGE